MKMLVHHGSNVTFDVLLKGSWVSEDKDVGEPLMPCRRVQ